MSASTDNKWRRTPQAGPPARSQNASSRDRSGASTPKDRQSTGQLPGNAWSGHERNRSVAGGQGQSQDGVKGAKGLAPVPASGAGMPTGEQHVSVRRFEGTATKEWMKKEYIATVSGLDAKAVLWRPKTDSAGGPKPGAWGRKPNAMASGQDFWVNLRRELKNAEQAK